MGKTMRSLFDLALATAVYGLYSHGTSRDDGAPHGDRLPDLDARVEAWPESDAESHPEAVISELPRAASTRK